MIRLARFASATGQRWKYRVWVAALTAALAASAAFFSLWNGNPAGLPVGLTTGIYFPVVGFWFAWWAAAIRCPECGVRIGWYHMTHESHRDAAERIAMADHCPACGFAPTSTTEASG